MADAIKCDNCGSFTERPMTSGYVQRDAYGIHSADKPDGWVTFATWRHPHDFNAVTDAQGEFCGYSCAAWWFSEYVKGRCDGCGKTMAEHGPLANCRRGDVARPLGATS